MTAMRRFRRFPWALALAALFAVGIAAMWFAGDVRDVFGSDAAVRTLSPGHLSETAWIADLQTRTPPVVVAALMWISVLGDEEFYVLVFPVLYWAVDRRLGMRLGAVLLASATVNAVLKVMFVTPRPMFIDANVAYVRESSFGMPSGHAQNGAAVWGLLSTAVRRRWALVLWLVVLVVGWSRVHLGAHFVRDVVVGWMIGITLLGGFEVAEPHMRRIWRRSSDMQLVGIAAAGALALVMLAVVRDAMLADLTVRWPAAPDVAPFTSASHAITPAATFVGLAAGLVLLRRDGGFDHRGAIGRRVARVLVGIAGVVVIWRGLAVVLPAGGDPVALASRFLRYGLVGIWTGGLAPMVFVRLRLAARPGALHLGDRGSDSGRLNV
ncbi:MAG: phosphatase PAP2 family protein [Nitriliruptoraceae bacterium]